MPAAPEEDASYVARVVAFLRQAQPARAVANALLELGLPRIRAWLREKAGPNADVGEIRIEKDGALVHLDRLRVPLGARGLLVLDHASATIVRGKNGLPEARLEEYRGVLTFGSGAESFRADVSFLRSTEADADAWIAGDLTIANATWTAKSGREARAMTGKARLFVSPAAWRIEDGLLETETLARVRFAGHGALDGTAPLEEARLDLETAKVGPFADALTAIGGQALTVPAFVPHDALLRGDIVWDVRAGGRCALSIRSEAIDANIDARVGPDGNGLDGRIEADIRPAVTLRAANIPTKALPRNEDRVRVEVDVKGRVDHPIAHGTIRAPSVGFRFGRPRFLPCPTVRMIDGTVDVDGNLAHARLSANAGLGSVLLEVDSDLRAPEDLKASVTLDGLDGGFVREVLTALGLPAVVPRELRASAKLRGEGSAISGSMRLETPRSHIAIEPLRLSGRDPSGTHVKANIALADIALPNAPVELRGDGAFVLALEGSRSGEEPAFEGSFELRALELVIASRPDLFPFALDTITGRLAVERAKLALTEVRFRAYDGRWRGEATFDAKRPRAPAYTVWLEDASVVLLAQLAQLAGGRLNVRVAREGKRPDDEVWLPKDARVSGEIRGAREGPAIADLALESDAGTALVFHGEIGATLDGSTLRGNVALADALLTGALSGSSRRPLPEGTVRIDAKVKGPPDALVMMGYIFAPILRVSIDEKVDPLVVTDASALFRTDEEKTIWHRCVARLYGGALTSAGAFRHDEPFVTGTVAIANVAIEELPSEEGTLAPFVRGLLAVTLRFQQKKGTFRGYGNAELHEASFPALARGAEALGKYGLSPPSEEAIAPLTANIVVDEDGIALTRIRAWVKGANAAGDVRVGNDGSLLGYVTVLLEEEYLRSSAVLVVPRVLAERLTLPVRLKGNVGRPIIDADLGACFNKLVTDNKVSSFFVSAVEEAAAFFGAHPIPAPPAEADAAPSPAEDDPLFSELLASSPEWDEIEMRLADHRRSHVRYRIG